jgi:hypothetical protein
VGHPFFGVVVALRSVADRFGLEPGDEYAPNVGAWVDEFRAAEAPKPGT